MEKLKKIFSLTFLGIIVAVSVLIGFVSPQSNSVFAEEPEKTRLEKNFSMTDEERNYVVNLRYKTYSETSGDIEITMTPEHDEEKLKTFQKYVKKSIDSADVGEVFYVTLTPSDPDNTTIMNASMEFNVKLPKFYKNKEIAVIPFNDYRTTQRVVAVTVQDDGFVRFYGSTKAYAYAIVYNGIYKDIILIGIILFSVLIICVLVKVYCLRKDNPVYIEKRKEKATAKKKEQHKQNKRLAQELKREKEKLSKKNYR